MVLILNAIDFNLTSRLRVGLNLVLSLYIFQEGEVIGLMAHPPLLLVIIPKLKDLKQNNIMHEDVLECL